MRPLQCYLYVEMGEPDDNAFARLRSGVQHALAWDDQISDWVLVEIRRCGVDRAPQL